jgi:hypothetical protein
MRLTLTRPASGPALAKPPGCGAGFGADAADLLATDGVMSADIAGLSRTMALLRSIDAAN